MCKSTRIAILGLVALLIAASPAPTQQALAQQAPYIGFVYPAGGQQGTTVQVRLGGQRLDGLYDALISGPGVHVEVAHFYRKLSNQEVTLLREQLKELRQKVSKQRKAKQKVDPETQQFIERLETRIGQWVNRPASDALSSIAVLEVTIDQDAQPGEREIRLVGARGVSNPMVFYVGQLPEYVRKPMTTSPFQVLGKEALAQRKRPPEEIEQQVTLPCTVNGQIASGEVNQYRFEARQGQRLVITAKARELVPYIADAVPGWFQPVLALHDSHGNELAFNDDYRFKPDPTLFFEVPADGEYVLSIIDAIYRGREDFVYRVTIGELPFVTSIFPLGSQAGQPVTVETQGWNLDQAQVSRPSPDDEPGVYEVIASTEHAHSDPLPFAIGTLPEAVEQEPNDQQSEAQAVKLPLVINGRIDQADDWDMYTFEGTAGQSIVAEIEARRLESALDSMIKITDAAGVPLAMNDDHMDATSGLQTHHADSYASLTLPQDGQYFVHVGDTARDGGPAHAYRLRISEPLPDYELRVVPSSVNIRPQSAANVTVYAFRKDGFNGPIKVSVKNLPQGISAAPVTLKANQKTARLVVKTNLRKLDEPVDLQVVGQATIGEHDVTHSAVPAEDRMQAFLWRHLVPTENLKALVLNPSAQTFDERPRPPKLEPTEVQTEQVKFSPKQVAGRLRQLNMLFDEWLLTDDFYRVRVAECEVVDAADPKPANKNK